MMWYMYTVEYVPGKLLSTADALSRAPASTISLIEENLACVVENHINLILNALPATEDGLQNVRSALLSDPVCSQIIEFCKNGWPSNKNLDHTLQPFKKVSDDLCYHRGLCIKGSCLCIETCLNVFMRDTKVL